MKTEARRTSLQNARTRPVFLLSDQDIEAIRLPLQGPHALGSNRFRAAIGARLALP